MPTLAPALTNVPAAGFNNIQPEIGYDNNVINKYFRQYFPKAVSHAANVLVTCFWGASVAASLY